MNKKRLIILISSSEAGGAQVYILNLARHLKELYSIVVVCPNGYLSERLEEIDIELLKSEINISKIEFIYSYLLNQQKQYGNIIVNSHLLGTTLWTALAMLPMKSYRLVATLHQPIIYDRISYIKRLTFPLITKFLSSRVDEFISVSKEIANSIFEYTERSSKYIPNSVPDIENKKKCEEAFADGNIKIGIIGRLVHQKNHSCFLKAAKLINKALDKSRFYIIGDGELRNNLEREVKDYGIDNLVTFTGFVKEPYNIIKSMDIIVFSSDFEGIPLAMLETMSIGVPIVSTNVGGIPQIIGNGVDGLLVEPRMPKAIADAVIKLHEDNELYKKIHFNAIAKLCDEYNYAKNLQEYSNILSGDGR